MARKRSAKSKRSHFHTERSAIYLFITSAALAVSVSGLAIYLLPLPSTPSGFSVAASGPNYAMNLVIGPAAEALSSSSYSLIASIGDALIGVASGPSYNINFGPIAFVTLTDEDASGVTDNGGPTCDLFQSASKIEVGQSVNLTVVCTDLSNVTLVTLETDENNKVFKQITAHYGSPRTTAGEKAVATFIWQNSDVPDGTRISWRVRAKDGKNNEATQGTSSFDVGEVTATSNASTTAQPPSQTPLQPLPTGEEKEETKETGGTVGILPSTQEEEKPADNTAYLYLAIVAGIVAVIGIYYVVSHRKAAASPSAPATQNPRTK